jgi:hypothetical protein
VESPLAPVLDPEVFEFLHGGVMAGVATRDNEMTPAFARGRSDLDVTILYRGETLEKSMSRRLVEQLANRTNIHVEYRAELDRDPFLLETSVPGIFACGDVRFSPVKRVAAAVGEGSMAIAFVHQYLNAN